VRKALYIFGLLNDSDIEWMARVGTRRVLVANEVVIEEGRPAQAVIFLLEGEFVVSSRSFGEVARLSVGDIVGEMSFVDSAPPSASVTADARCLALFVDRLALSRKIESDLGFGCRFYRALAVFLADRLRDTTHRLTDGDQSDGVTRLDDNRDVLKDELDIAILDNLSMAGDRFHRMLRLLAGGR
jgi:CRP-like cAMP-binding protein